MAVTLRRGPREPAPEVPTGRIVLQPPPEIAPSEGSSGLLMNAVPMLGSVGSIVFVALSQPGPKGYLAAGMFLIASLGFVGVNGLPAESAAPAGVIEARREYLAYLAEVRDTVRTAADRQRRAAWWNYPDAHGPGAPVAEERSRVWERASGTTTSCRCGSVAPASRSASPSNPGDPADGPAGPGRGVRAAPPADHPPRPARPPGGPSTCASSPASRWPATRRSPTRGLARAMVLEAAQHGPDQLLVAVVAATSALPPWEWVKWLPHTPAPRERDGVGPSRMIAPSLNDLEPLLPADLREPTPVRPRRPARPAPRPRRRRRRRGAPRQRHRHRGGRPRRHRPRPARTLGRARRAPAGCGSPSGTPAHRPRAGQAPLRSAPSTASPSPGAPTSSRSPRPRRPPAGWHPCHAGAGAERRDPCRSPPTCSTCSASATSATRPGPRPGGRGSTVTGSGCRSVSVRRARSSLSTSRSPRSRAWARTA